MSKSSTKNNKHSVTNDGEKQKAILCQRPSNFKGQQKSKKNDDIPTSTFIQMFDVFRNQAHPMLPEIMLRVLSAPTRASHRRLLEALGPSMPCGGTEGIGWLLGILSMVLL